MKKKVKILVCYHKPATLLKNKFFVPIHVGRSVAFQQSKDGKITSKEFDWMKRNLIGDDTGVNISAENRNYCELTALYWAWKNQNRLGNPDYIGLMHYRRVIKFNDIYKNYYCVNNKQLDNFFNSTDFDLILTKPKPCFSVVNNVCSKNVYDHFCQEHGIRMTHIMLDCIKLNYPEMTESLNRVMFGCKTISWYNILVASKKVFNDYCTWLFDILKIINQKCIDEDFEMDSSRMMGYYGEILLNIFFSYYSNNNKELRIIYLDDVRLHEENINEIISCSPSAVAKRILKKYDKKGDYKNAILFRKFLLKKKKIKHNERISTIHSLTYREFAPNGGKGGGSAVLSCQKILLKDSYRHLKLKYSFIEDNYYNNKENELWDLWAAADFAYNKAINEKNTAYITHDYGTAFGLYLAGKKYVLVSHIQGARVEEKKNFGEVFTTYSEKIIKHCEKLAMENAEMLCFPSYGAYQYLTESKYTIVDFNKINLGPVLYNTLYIQPAMQLVEKIPEKKEFLTILSVGQMTVAKGMDQSLNMISELLNRTDRKIRWILVGQGPLLGDIIKNCVDLMKKKNRFIFSHVGSCSYSQMQYLQNISDVYLMLQRISIFDLATLEAMIKSKCIVLSNVGGNVEFNMENNIILFDNDYDRTINQLLSADIKAMGEHNKRVYDKYFSNKCFLNSYHHVIDLLAGIEPEHQFIDSDVYEKEIIELKNALNELRTKNVNTPAKAENGKSITYAVDNKVSGSSNDAKCNDKKQVKVITKDEKYIPVYDVVEAKWRNAESLPEEIITEYINNSTMWDKENNRLWLVIACMLIDKNNNAQLKTLMDKYIKKYKEKDIFRYMPLAEYITTSKQLTFSDKRIKQSADLFKTFNVNLSNNVFHKILCGKKVAVVGNGPSEIGRSLGKEIDSHDIVIRFNNYDTKGFEADYGSKTSIWVRGSGASDVINRPDISLYELVVFEGDYYHYPVIPKDHPEAIHKYLGQNTPICYFDHKIHKSLKEYSGIENPTSGLVTIWALYMIKKDIKQLDIYGFSFRQNNIDNIATHYFNDRGKEEAIERSKVHTLDKESEVILGLLEKNNSIRFLSSDKK